MKLAAFLLPCAVLLPSLAAMADEAAPQPEEQKIEKKIRLYGLTAFQMNLFESDDKNSFDTAVGYVRLGALYDEGILSGRVVVEVAGEKKDAAALYVRQAQLGVKLPTDTTVEFGRIRPQGARAWGADGTWGPHGFGHIHGAAITQKLDLPTAPTTLRLYYANELSNYESKHPTELPWGYSHKSGRAYILQASSTIAEMVSVTGVIGYEPNMYTQKPVTGKDMDGDGNTTDPIDIAEAEGQAANKLIWAVSVGHDSADYGFGSWLSQNITGDSYKAELDGVDLKTVGNKTSTAVTSTRFGIGGNVNSRLFAVSDILQKGDSLSPGISYEYNMKRSGAETSSDDDFHVFATSVAYLIGNADITLGHSLTATNKTKKFPNRDGEKDKESISQSVYLWGSLTIL